MSNVLEFRSPVIRNPKDSVAWLSDIKSRDYENFVYLSMDGEFNVLSKKIIFTGNDRSCRIQPRDLWRDILMTDNVRAVIFAHNHPSGSLVPSEDDMWTHQKLVEAGNVLGIQVLDSVIVTKDDYYSMTENE